MQVRWLERERAGRHSAPVTYRPHIDGLRAVAVLAVVLYHAHAGVAGGFVGVDVFFVISGFLITGLLFEESQRTGDISLAGFYERRVRRLAPALALVLAATLLLGWIYLTPIGGEQQGLAKSLIATITLSSNVYFAANTGGYFDQPVELQPLLHTWSLSVEEQFYMAWPLALLVLSRRVDPARRVVLALCAVTLVCFVLCVVSTVLYPQFAFFSSPTRAWEFSIGGLAYFLLRKLESPVPWANLISLLGLASVLGSCFLLEPGGNFPGALAAIPVAGTFAIIIGCENARVPVARLLSARPLVFVGLVSYSFYLWHWPLLAIARAHLLGELTATGALAICAAAFGLASLTYFYVESPVRLRRVQFMSNRRQVFAAGLTAGTLLLLASGAMGASAKFGGPGSRNDPGLAAALGSTEKVRVACWQPRPYSGNLLDRPDCDFPLGRRPAILLWGDSHAAHLLPMMQAALSGQDLAVRIRYMPECPPLLDFDPELAGINRSVGCQRFNRDVLDEITRLRSRGLVAVVLAARWPSYLRKPEARLKAADGLRKELAALNRMKLKAIVVAPGPTLPHEAPACLARRDPSECGIARSVAESARAQTMGLLTSIVSSDGNALMLDPFKALCTAERCDAISAGQVIYSDAHHLSVNGSLRLVPLAAAALRAVDPSLGGTRQLVRRKP
jgi:peptidoglycan/LPS O-acetylase OafA/YrhL